MTDHLETFESYLGKSKNREGALRLMDREAQEASNWARERITKVDVGNPGYTQPDTNLDGVQIRLVCSGDDGWRDTFLSGVLEILSREHHHQDGEVLCWVVIKQVDEKRRTRLKGYVTTITDQALTFFDGASVRLEDVVEVAL